MRRSIVVVALVLGCGNVTDAPDASPGPGPDAPVVGNAPPARELATAAGRMTGGTWTVDVQLGSLASQSAASGGTWTARGGSPLNP